MLSKNEIKDIQSLRHKKYRDASGLFIAEGPKIVNELLSEVPAHVHTVYATANWRHSGGVADVREISEMELQRISQLKTPNEVVAVLKTFSSTTPQSGFTLFLDTVQDPGNMGTIIRVADWFGVKSIVCSSGCADIYNIKVIQSSMASIARVNVWYDEAGDWLQKLSGKKIYAAALDGKPLHEVEMIEDAVLLIGNESKGIREEYLRMAQERITIPRRGQAESLNVAIATGIILSHWFI